MPPSVSEADLQAMSEGCSILAEIEYMSERAEDCLYKYHDIHKSQDYDDKIRELLERLEPNDLLHLNTSGFFKSLNDRGLQQSRAMRLDTSNKLAHRAATYPRNPPTSGGAGSDDQQWYRIASSQDYDSDSDGKVDLLDVLITQNASNSSLLGLANDRLEQHDNEAATSPLPENLAPPPFVPAHRPVQRERATRHHNSPNAEGSALSTSSSLTEKWFEELSSRTHSFIYGEAGKFQLPQNRRIRIAILDSGLAFAESEYYNLAAFRDNIVAGKSFIGGTWDRDEHGHGTAVASLVAKTAPNVALYIAKVLRYDPVKKMLAPDKDAVASAIRHAVDEDWDVDIVNMSFGSPYDDHEGMRRAIHYASTHERKDGTVKEVIMLAATSNAGALEKHDLYYPSRSGRLIAIDSADGYGNEAPQTSSTEDQTSKLRFTAPGVDVMCNWPLHQQPDGTADGTKLPQTGASFACAVATGVAALILEFANQEPCSWVPQLSKALHRRRAMEAIFKKMSKVKFNDRFKFLSPTLLLEGSCLDQFGGEASPESERWAKACDIAKAVHGEYGGLANFRKEIFDEWTRRTRQS